MFNVSELICFISKTFSFIMNIENIHYKGNANCSVEQPKKSRQTRSKLVVNNILLCRNFAATFAANLPHNYRAFTVNLPQNLPRIYHKFTAKLP
jgi:hypothetical protein